MDSIRSPNNSMRTGLSDFGGEDVEDAAAQRILADHFDWFAILVADAFQMREQVFERHFVAHAHGEGELAVEFGGLGLQQRRGDGRDGDGERPVARRHRPMARCSAISVCGERRWCGRTSSAGIELRLRDFASGDEEVEERVDRFRQGLGGGVAIGDDDQRALGGLPEQDRVEGFRGRCEAGKRDLGGAIAQTARRRLPETRDGGPGFGRDRGLRGASRILPNALDDGGGGIAGFERQSEDAAAGGFHFLAAGDEVRPVRTFYEDVGQERRRSVHGEFPRRTKLRRQRRRVRRRRARGPVQGRWGAMVPSSAARWRRC